MRDDARAGLVRRLDEQPRDERARQRGGERIDALVARAGLQRRPHEVGDERRAGIDGDRTLRPAADRAFEDAVAGGPATHVGGEGDHLVAVRLAQPRDGDRGIEAARVGEDDGFAHEVLRVT